MKKETKHGIEYNLPEVLLLQETGIGTSEIAARTCYDSFENSENDCIRLFNNGGVDTNIDLVNSIARSDLLDDLAWTYFHHSILEHANLTYLIKGTSRAVLQEHARHRIQAISVKSTRYTMSSVINAFVASKGQPTEEEEKNWFIANILKMNMFITLDSYYNALEAGSMFSKLEYQLLKLGYKEFQDISIAKSSLALLNGNSDEVFNALQAGKKKRNVGDAFKHIVTDNWKVDMVVTMNLRALKNYFTLRDSGAAYFQIQWLAQAMKDATPKKYLDLIIKDKK